MMVREQGFTLIELVVAMTLFAIMTTLAYGGLDTFVDHRDALQSRSEHFAMVQKTVQLIRRDLAHATPRGVRDAQGGYEPAMSGGHDQASLQITSARRDSDNGTGLVRVEYALVDGELRRSLWPVLDRMPEHRTSSHMLAHDVTSFGVRFAANREYHMSWPAQRGDATKRDTLPDAVEVSFDLTDGTHYRIVVPVSGNG